ncbi:hypothetical protein BpHYR1_035283 [Brachionus plicatilis]|uniref:Uncharacterized protein n=1 Tax=Brachionus plicatilis TaxID=10195 RepID=A0A3M7P5M1_BRAPC|nr:hypothetical protein BpHYR1_035283 [Brachionus plicatilis]
MGNLFVDMKAWYSDLHGSKFGLFASLSNALESMMLMGLPLSTRTDSFVPPTSIVALGPDPASMCDVKPASRHRR